MDVAEPKKAAASKKVTPKTTTPKKTSSKKATTKTATPKKTVSKTTTATKTGTVSKSNATKVETKKTVIEKQTAPKKQAAPKAEKYCEYCGNGLVADAEFCPKCGKLVGNKKTASQSSANNNKVFNILSYIGILWLIGMFCESKNDKDVRFHVGQGILISILEVVVGLINGLVIANVFVTRHTYWYYTYTETSALGYVLMTLLSLVPLAFAILGIVNAVKGEKKELPIIGKWAFYK